MAELKKKVNHVRNGLGASKTDLSVQLIRFDVLGTKVVLFAADKEVFCRTEMKVTRPEDAKDGSYSVLGAKLERLISQVDVETLIFSQDPENLEVQAGFLTVNLELYDGAVLRTIEHGVLPEFQKEGLSAPREALDEGLSCAKACSTTTSLRPEVTHAELRNGRLLSSDGRKIMVYTHDRLPQGMLLKVPATALSSVLGAVKNTEAENVAVQEGSSYFIIRGNLNEYAVGVRKVERTFPAVEAQVKTVTANDEVSLDKHVLEAMLRGVSLGLGSDDVKVTIEVGGTGAEAYLEVSAKNAIGRRSHERASAGRKSEEKLAFPVSYKHLLDTLSVFKGDSVVDVMILTAQQMLMVRDTTKAREVLTIIPFRTDQQVDAEKKEAAATKTTEKEKVEVAAAPALAEEALSTAEDVQL